MFNKSFLSVLIVTSAFTLIFGQTPEAKKDKDNLAQAFAWSFDGDGGYLVRRAACDLWERPAKRGALSPPYSIGILLGPARMLQDFLGQELAVAKYGHQMTQPDGGARQSIECSGMLLAQAHEVMQALLGRG